jgi:hypothetical protein
LVSWLLLLLFYEPTPLATANGNGKQQQASHEAYEQIT